MAALLLLPMLSTLVTAVAPRGADALLALLVAGGVGSSAAACTFGTCSNGKCGALCTIPCDAGTYCGGSCSCDTCPAGKYGGGSSACNDCPAGKWSSATGATSDSTCISCVIGTYSGAQGATSSSTCLPCIVGSYGNTTGLTTSDCSGLCEAGTFSSVAGATTKSVCTPCPTRTFSNSVGRQYNCTLCDEGSYNGRLGAIACLPCPPGTASSVRGALDKTVCEDCAVDYFAKEPGLPACQKCNADLTTLGNKGATMCFCPPGTIYDYADGFQVITQDHFDCTPCKDGQVAIFSTITDRGRCEVCPEGHYCSKGVSKPCPSGRYSNGTGLVKMEDCTPCEPGTFSPSEGQTKSVVCVPCSSGYFSTLASPQCLPCPAGTYNPSTKSDSDTACKPCPLGKYSAITGQASCLELCDKGKYGKEIGQTTDESACTLCVLGSTASPGSTDESQCTQPVDCGPNNQYKRTSPPSLLLDKDADCIKLECPFPLKMYPSSSSRTGCLACPPGKYFSLVAKNETSTNNNCTSCRDNKLCPGFTKPFNSTYSLSGLNSSASGFRNTFCLSAAAKSTVLVSLTPGAFTLTSIPSIATMGSGIGLILFSFFFVVFATCTARPRARARDREPCNVRCAASVSRWIKSVDGFALNHRPIENEPQRFVPSLLGGFCNLAGYLSFAIIATYYCLRFGYDNTVLSVSLNTVRADYNPFTPDVPWASPVSPVIPPLPASTSLQVRVFAHSPSEGPSDKLMVCASVLEMAGVSLNAGSWSSETTNCDNSRTLITFSCSRCEFTSTSEFHFLLPYTCQATYVEIVSTDATGALVFVALNPKLTTATTNSLITSISWTVGITASLYDNLVENRRARGYLLQSEAASSKSVPPTLVKFDKSDWSLLNPLEASVSFSIFLPRSPVFSSTTLTLRQTIADLASTLVGLLGLLGAFRIFFVLAERMCAPAPPPDPAAAKRALNAPIVMKDLSAPKFRPEQSADIISSSTSPRSSLRNLSPDRGTSFVQENPLRSSGRALTPRIDDSGTPSGSRRHLGPRNFSHDDFDVPSESSAYDNPLRAFVGFDSSPQLSEPRRHLGPPVFSHDESNEPGNSLHGHDAALQGGRRHLAPAGFSHGGDME